MTRTTRTILATAATLALLAGAALAQGPRFGAAAPSDDAAAQRDQVREQIRDPDTHVEMGAVGPMHDRIAEALGITAEELTAKHAEGLTLAEIAASLGVELDDLPVGPAQAGGRNVGGGQAYGPQGRLQRDVPRGPRN